MWPRTQITHLAELDREIRLKEGNQVNLQVFVDGNLGVFYLNNIIAMNFRAYDLPEGNWGFFVVDGSADFSNINISSL